MSFLVTGGAGFIGSHLVEALLAGKESVVVIDDFSMGKEENLAKCDKRLKIYNARCSEIPKIRGLENIEHVFHLGMPSSSPLYEQNPSLKAQSLREFRILLEFSRKNDAGLTLASTSSLYGGNPTPHREDMAIRPFDEYTRTKFTMEKMLAEACGKYGISGAALRLFSVYGPREEHKGRYANLVSQFIWEMSAGRRPVVYGNGTQSRDFTYVYDVVNAFILTVSFNGCGTFNVGTGTRTSINDLVRLINGALKTNIRPKNIPNPIENYVVCTLADTDKSKEALGFEAKTGVISGIGNFLGGGDKRQ